MPKGDPAPVAVDENEKAGGSKDKAASRVAEYLQAPRRKRKSFVVMAMAPRSHTDVQPAVEAYVRTQLKTTALSAPRTPEELVRNFSRQIVLLVFDDEFTDLTRGLELVRDLKSRKAAEGVPVLFLTRDPARLIDAYNKVLLPWHEGDDYVDLRQGETPLVLSRIKAGLSGGYRRRSRRYRIDLAVHFELLGDESRRPGRLLDLSLHGAFLKAEDGRLFKAGEQVKFHVPLTAPIPEVAGDFLRLAGRVRRVGIGGTQAGIAFEHVSDQQQLALTRFLTGVVADQTVRRLAQYKARLAAARS